MSDRAIFFFKKNALNFGFTKKCSIFAMWKGKFQEFKERYHEKNNNV